jgi:hypothetical protein
MDEKKSAAEPQTSEPEGMMTAVARNVGSALGAIAAKTHRLVSRTKVAKRVSKKAKASRAKATGRGKSLQKSLNTGTRKNGWKQESQTSKKETRTRLSNYGC